MKVVTPLLNTGCFIGGNPVSDTRSNGEWGNGSWVDGGGCGVASP
jgi:hypothetical protein